MRCIQLHQFILLVLAVLKYIVDFLSYIAFEFSVSGPQYMKTLTEWIQILIAQKIYSHNLVTINITINYSSKLSIIIN